jgi:hypothetical protein
MTLSYKTIIRSYPCAAWLRLVTLLESIMTTTAKDIIDDDGNSSVLENFFTSQASGDYYDGNSYQLYFDLGDNSLFEHMEASDQSWLQRNDNSLIQILTVCGYDDIPEDERYTTSAISWTSATAIGWTTWRNGSTMPSAAMRSQRMSKNAGSRIHNHGLLPKSTGIFQHLSEFQWLFR